jgi:hypothetical protein
MPDEVRALRAPWPALAGEVPGLTRELEREFRFGQRVSATEKGFLLGGTMKGGSSSMWLPVGRDQFESFLRWRSIDGFVEGGDDGARDELIHFLAGCGIELAGARATATEADPAPFRRDLAQVYPLMLAILRELPREHLRRDVLRRIQLGGWGPDAAKASAYEAGTVHIYDFAVRGARRTFVGLVLHELGHAHEHSLAADHKEALRRAHATLARTACFYGIEYLLDSASRIAYQRLALEEFIAETYLAYTACGGALRAWIEGRAPEERAAWRSAYAVYADTFLGAEYE